MWSIGRLRLRRWHLHTAKAGLGSAEAQSTVRSRRAPRSIRDALQELGPDVLVALFTPKAARADDREKFLRSILRSDEAF